jgi:hypothetical protein
LETLTPLSSEDEESEEEEEVAKNTEPNAGQFSQRLKDLQKAFEEIQDLSENFPIIPDPVYDLDRPGIQMKQEESKESKIVGFERTGVTHLVHAWHEKVKKNAKVNLLYLRLRKLINSF